MNSSDKYNFSFTAASLEVQEFRRCAQVYRANGYTWGGLELPVLQTEVLGKINPSTAGRKLTEFKKRIAYLSSEQVDLLSEGSYADATGISFLACIKSYPILRDYCNEVLALKLTSFDKKASAYELSQFIDSKTISHSELANITSNTRSKIEQVIKRILAQAGILTGEEIQPLTVGNDTKTCLATEQENILRAMLLEPSTFKAIKGMQQ